jgi:hypothetical protein
MLNLQNISLEHITLKAQDEFSVSVNTSGMIEDVLE